MYLSVLGLKRSPIFSRIHMTPPGPASLSWVRASALCGSDTVQGVQCSPLVAETCASWFLHVTITWIILHSQRIPLLLPDIPGFQTPLCCCPEAPDYEEDWSSATAIVSRFNLTSSAVCTVLKFTDKLKTMTNTSAHASATWLTKLLDDKMKAMEADLSMWIDDYTGKPSLKHTNWGGRVSVLAVW